MKEKPAIDRIIIGRNLHRARLDAGLSIVQVTEFLGLKNENSIYDYEEGVSLPRTDRFILLLWLYGIGVQELLERVPGTDKDSGKNRRRGS